MSPLSSEARREVERAFDAEAPGRLARLAAALEDEAAGNGNGAAAREAHTLRGAAAIVGRRDLADLCSAIEDLVAAPAAPDELRRAAARVRTLVPEPVDRRSPRRRSRWLARQIALLVALALLPAVVVAVYAVLDGRRDTHRLVAREAMADAQLVAASEVQLRRSGRDLLDGLAATPAVAAAGPSCPGVLGRYAAAFPSFAPLRVVAADGRTACSGQPESPAPRPGGLGAPLRRPLPHGAHLEATITARAMQAVVAEARLPQGSAVLVVDASGTILARRPDPGRYVGRRIDAAALRSRVAEAPAEQPGLDGVRRLYGYAAAGPWLVRVGIPTAPEYASYTHELLWELLVIGALAAAALVVGVAYTRRRISGPFAALTDTAGRLAKGDLSARTNVSPGRGELGQLVVAVDSMAAALEERTAERERAVVELEALTRELDTRVDERTRALEAARGQAERANLAKTAFLSRLSHELRTPLNAVRGFAQILDGDAVPDEQREAIRYIASGAEHMTRLIDELLDTARIEAGQLRVDPEPVAVAAAFREVVDLSGPLATEHGVALTVSELERGLSVVADRGRLRQVLLNLVTNGVVYNRRGGSVTLRATRLAAGRVAIDVADTGEGIAAADLDRVFVAYDRLGRGPESGGLGLGLALSKRIVEALDGSISIASERGVGTRFTVELPEAAAAGSVVDAAPPAAPRAGAGASSTSRTTRRACASSSCSSAAGVSTSWRRPRWPRASRRRGPTRRTSSCSTTSSRTAAARASCARCGPSRGSGPCRS